MLFLHYHRENPGFYREKCTKKSKVNNKVKKIIK